MSSRAIDPDLDADQRLGCLSQNILTELWPGFAAQDLEIWMNPVYLRRHLAGRKVDYLERVAFFNQQAETLVESFGNIVAIVRYDRVPIGQAGLTAFAELGRDVHGARGFMAFGLRILPVRASGKRNHVTTIMRVSEAKMRRMLERSPHVTLSSRDGGVDSE